MVYFNLNKIKINFSGILEYLAKKIFFVFLFFSILVSLLAGIVFYKYAYSVKNSKPETNTKELKINTDDYQKMVNYWSERLKIFEGADTKEFKSPF